MTRLLIPLVVLFCAVAPPARAADEPKLTKAEVAKKAKPSTAFVMAKVDLRGRAVTSQGTAFCVHSSGLFVTNEHVIKGASEIELVLNPSEKNEKVYKATVVRTAEKEDLALLRVETKEPLPVLVLGDDGKLEELTDVIACGYPFGTSLTFGAKDFPSITTTVGAVSSLRKKDGKLELIQLDVNLNPGNSGGPILDLTGKVVGVALGGIRGTQLNFAIPVSQVAAFLAKPEFVFTAPAIKLSDRGKPVAVTAQLVSFAPGAADADVELEVRRGKAAPTRHAMKLDKGAYRAEVVLVPEQKGTTKLGLEVAFADGGLTAQVADRTVKIGAAEHKLSAVRSLSPAKGHAVLGSGERVSGAITGLDAVPVTLGGKEITIDLSTAQELTIGLQLDVPVIVLEVVARGGGKEIGRVSRSVILDESNKVFLADLEPSGTRPGPWPLGIGTTGTTDHKPSTPIKINGKLYPKGLGLHANDPPATATYRLSKSASVFRATVAYNDDNDGKVSGPCHFEVYGDGKLLWKSKAITSRNQFDECLVDVTGVESLELRVSLSGLGFGAHAVWLDPILVGPEAAAIRRASAKK